MMRIVLLLFPSVVGCGSNQLTLSFELDGASCGVGQPEEVSLDYAGTVAIHVVDREHVLEPQRAVLASGCAAFSAVTGRSLMGLPALLGQVPPITDLSPGASVSVEVEVHRGAPGSCARAAGPDTLELLGSSTVFGVGSADTIDVRLHCRREPVVHFRFDEGKGDRAADASGRGNIGTIEGPSWVEGVRGNALSFDGADDHVRVREGGDGSMDLGNNDLTVAAWVKTTLVGLDQAILSKHSQGADAGYALFVDRLGRLSLYLRDGDDPLETLVHSTSQSYADGAWHHVAAVADRDGVVTFYRDGEPDGTAPIKGSGGSLDNPHAAFVGSRFEDVGVLAGTLDDLQLHDSALSAEEITALAGGR